jgi:hypothetical protein
VINARISRLTLVFAVVLTSGIPASAAAADAPAVPAPATPPTGASAPDKPTDGKYYLIWRVTAPKVEVGAEVEVEPAFFTNGEKIVFAWDYCRQYYLNTHKPKFIPISYKYEPDYVVNPQDIAENLESVHRYCEYQPVRLEGTHYVLLNNHGARFGIGDITFEAPVLEGRYERAFWPPIFPKSGRATITKIEIGVSEQLPAAKAAAQSYGFLMSSNAKLLERLVPVSRSTREQIEQFDVRLNYYLDLRQEGKRTNPPADDCRRYAPEGYARELFRFEPARIQRPQVLDQFFVDFDADGNADMLAWVQEKRSDSTLRIFLATGYDVCAVYRKGGNPSAFSYPVLLAHIGECYYGMTKYPGDEGGNDAAVLAGPSDRCRDRVVVNRLSKHVHAIPAQRDFGAAKQAR